MNKINFYKSTYSKYSFISGQFYQDLHSYIFLCLKIKRNEEQ